MPARTAATNATRRRVLDAGIELWRSEPPEILFGGYTVARLAKAAGVTRATFYSYWPSTAAYMQDLLAHLATLDPELYDEGAGPSVRGVKFAVNELATPFLAACDAQMRAVVKDPALRVRLGFLSKMDDPEVAAALRHRYRSLEDWQWSQSSRMFESWGRELRPPVTPRQLMAVHSGLQEFVAAQHVVDPEAVPLELYGYISLIMLMMLSRRIDDPRTVDDILGVTDMWPMMGLNLLATKAGGPAVARSAVEPEQVRGMTQMARTILASLPWEDLHLADVGRSIGFNEELAMRAFVTKAGLGVSIISMCCTERFDLLEPTGDPLADLREMLVVIREELDVRPAITQSVLVLFARETRFPSEQLMPWSPVPALAAQITRAAEAGQLDAPLSARELAWTLLRVILLDSAPSLRGVRLKPDVAELVLRGVGAAPDHTAGGGSPDFE